MTGIPAFAAREAFRKEAIRPPCRQRILARGGVFVKMKSANLLKYLHFLQNC